MHKGKVAVIGLVGQSAFLQVSRFPVPGETIQSHALSFEIGGKGYNQAIAASKMGVEAVFIGAVGSDLHGEECKWTLNLENVQGIFFEKDTPTAFATITIDRYGENIVQVFPGAAKELSERDLRRRDIVARLRECDYLLLQNELSEECLEAAIAIAQANGLPVILNPAPFTEKVKTVLPFCSLITPNYGEAKDMAGFSSKDFPTDLELAESLHKLGVKKAVITDGKNGAIVVSEFAVQRLPAFRFGEAVDTTGAGDVFNGALVASLIQGEPLLEAVQNAIVAAGISVTRKGAALGAPRKDEVIPCVEEYQKTLLHSEYGKRE